MRDLVNRVFFFQLNILQLPHLWLCWGLMGVSSVMVLWALPSLALGPSVQSNYLLLQGFTVFFSKSSLRTFGGVIKASRELVLIHETVQTRSWGEWFWNTVSKEVKTMDVVRFHIFWRRHFKTRSYCWIWRCGLYMSHNSNQFFSLFYILFKIQVLCCAVASEEIRLLCSEG